MSALQPPPEICKWCGENVPPKADRCPLCGRPVTAGPRVAPSGEPVDVAPGQEPFGSWANIKQIFQADKAFAAVLVLQVLDVLAACLSGSGLRILISIGVLYGLLTFRWWGLWLALAGSGLTALLWILIFLAAASTGQPAAIIFAIPAAVSLFVLAVLWSRRDRFD